MFKYFIRKAIGVSYLGLSYFMTLLITAILFFGAYGGFLLLSKENMTVELYNQTIEKIRYKIKR